jgi:hypothetical protein
MAQADTLSAKGGMVLPKEKAPARDGGLGRHRARPAPSGVRQWLEPRADRTMATMIDGSDRVNGLSVTISLPKIGYPRWRLILLILP